MTTGLLGAALMAALGAYYFCKKKTDRNKALLCKALTTAVPGGLMLFHLYGTTPGREQAAAVIGTTAAIIFYMAADVLLEYRFIWGAVSFAAGHICMSAGFLLSGESVLYIAENGRYRIDAGLFGWGIMIFAVLTATACIALCKYFSSLKKKNLFLPLLAYITVLGAMSSLAVTAGIRICAAGVESAGWTDAGGAAAGLITAAGGVCFAVSDILLGRNRLGRRRSVICGALVLILYYTAVYLFAMRLWL